MNKKAIIDILYSDDSIDKKFLKLEQKIKYKHEFTDEEFDCILFLLNELLPKNNMIPNNYSNLAYLTPKFSTEQCLKLSDLIQSSGFLFDIILCRNITFNEYKKCQFKIRESFFLSALLYLETRPEEQEELFEMILGKLLFSVQEKKEDTFTQDVCFVPSASSLPNFYENIFEFQKLVPVMFSNIYGGIPYNIKKSNSIVTKGSFEKLKMYFPNENFPSISEKMFTEIDLYLLNENPKLKKFLDSRIYQYSVTYSLYNPGFKKSEVVFKRKRELFKLVENNETICCESMTGLFPRKLGLDLNVPEKSLILSMSVDEIVRNTNYYDYFTGMNILSFKRVTSTDKEYFLYRRDNASNKEIFIELIEEIYLTYGLQEIINVFDTISKNPLSSFILIDFEIFKQLDEELINNSDYLKVIAPFVFFNIPKINGRHVYYDFLNLTEEQIKILNFIVV